MVRRPPPAWSNIRGSWDLRPISRHHEELFAHLLLSSSLGSFRAPPFSRPRDRRVPFSQLGRPLLGSSCEVAGAWPVGAGWACFQSEPRVGVSGCGDLGCSQILVGAGRSQLSSSAKPDKREPEKGERRRTAARRTAPPSTDWFHTRHPPASTHPNEGRCREPLGRTKSGGKGLAPQVGLEPTTLRLTAECSTIELLRSACVLLCFSELAVCLSNNRARSPLPTLPSWPHASRRRRRSDRG